MGGKILPVAEVVKNARKIKGLTQDEFAKEISKSQSVVSKYEKGLVSPPANIYSHCMNIIYNNHKSFLSEIELEELIKRLRTEFGGPEFVAARQLLWGVMDCMAISNSRGVGLRLAD